MTCLCNENEIIDNACSHMCEYWGDPYGWWLQPYVYLWILPHCFMGLGYKGSIIMQYNKKKCLITLDLDGLEVELQYCLYLVTLCIGGNRLGTV